MGDFMTHSGIASVAVDFTTELSLLIGGLLGLAGLSAGMIILAAIRHHRAQRLQPVDGTASTPPDQQQAA